MAGPFAEQDAVHTRRPRDILELLLASVLECYVEFAVCVLMDAARHADPARFGKLLQPRGDVDAVAKDVVAIDDDVADVDTDSQIDPLFGRHTGIALGHATLHVDRTAHRVDHAREFQQQPVARGLDDPAAVFGDLRVNKLPPMGLQSRQGGAVVAAHEQGIAHHIGRDDRRQSSVVPRQGRLP